MSANPYNGACITDVNTVADESVRKSSVYSAELKRRVLHFTPSWFSVNMGTGITSILLHNLPYNNVYLQRIAICIFVLNIALFVVFVGISAARYTMFPQVWKIMIRNPAQSLFLGTFPMGFATIINMIVFVCVPAFGERFVYLAWGLWWIDVLLSAAVGLGVCFMMFTRQKHSLDKLTAVWLLPIVPAVVAAASGGVVANALVPIAPHYARTTILVSYFIWGMGVPISFLVMALYFHRLCVHHVPPSEQIVSVFLPIGPCGQGAFGIMQLGKVLRALAYADNLSFGSALPEGASDVKIIASAVYGASLVVGLILWGMGVFWLCIAVATIVDIKRKGGFPVNMGAWGFTFPLGVLTTATTLLATELDSAAFKAVGTVFSICVILLWMYVAAWTSYKAFDGSMFVAPCLASMDRIPQAGDAEVTGSTI